MASFKRGLLSIPPLALEGALTHPPQRAVANADTFTILRTHIYTREHILR
ncbi:MAG: hypothetical protein IMZ69_07700 [Spirochaetes bacterium]|nr:hypothetical protein [Spirochaetota bacterium]